MTDDIYRKLAQRLDAIPNGFPATESGVELRLLAKIFTPIRLIAHSKGWHVRARFASRKVKANSSSD